MPSFLFFNPAGEARIKKSISRRIITALGHYQEKNQSQMTDFFYYILHFMFSPRQLRRLKRSAMREVKNKMREDLKYLLKPKPKYWPRFIWIFLLKILIDVDLKKI